MLRCINQSCRALPDVRPTLQHTTQAEALIFERTGKIAKAHRGLRAQFARLARDEPSIDQAISEFLGRAYELKSLAD
jgi:hypothetical protein